MKIIAFTGAGISKQSNIPTFMERPDVREKLFRSFACQYPTEYNQVIKQLKSNMNNAKPNDAHIALFEYDIPVITMNIDGLHHQAGTNALELHGGLPDDSQLDNAHTLYNKPVLYGDSAPNYQKAYEMIYQLQAGDILLVVGCSYSTAIAVDLREIARSNDVTVIEIQHDATTNVRATLEELLNHSK